MEKFVSELLKGATQMGMQQFFAYACTKYVKVIIVINFILMFMGYFVVSNLILLIKKIIQFVSQQPELFFAGGLVLFVWIFAEISIRVLGTRLSPKTKMSVK